MLQLVDDAAVDLDAGLDDRLMELSTPHIRVFNEVLGTNQLLMPILIKPVLNHAKAVFRILQSIAKITAAPAVRAGRRTERRIRGYATVLDDLYRNMELAVSQSNLLAESSQTLAQLEQLKSDLQRAGVHPGLTVRAGARVKGKRRRRKRGRGRTISGDADQLERKNYGTGKPYPMRKIAARAAKRVRDGGARDYAVVETLTTRIRYRGPDESGEFARAFHAALGTMPVT